MKLMNLTEKSLVVILLVLLISGGGGKFPIQVSSSCFQMINRLLPSTNDINLLREAIGGTYPLTVYHSMVILLLYIIIFLCMVILLLYIIIFLCLAS
ncbi:MAG: hypothetical protein ACK5HR_02315 [Mycoplasmatales bacterium]